MKRDPIVLAKDVILRGEDHCVTRPNSNVLAVGPSGCGKSTSVLLPSMARCEHSNPIVNFAKEYDAYCIAQFMRSKGKSVRVLNLLHPEKSTVSYDPILWIESDEDIDSLASAIVESSLQKTVDDYWNGRAKSIFRMLTEATLMTCEKGEFTGILDVLDNFSKLIPIDGLNGLSTKLDKMFEYISKVNPDSFSAEEYATFCSTPIRTASCERSTLATALNYAFPKAIRSIIKSKPQFDIDKFVKNNECLILISDGTDKSQQFYLNLFYSDLIRQLKRIAENLYKGELPREVRFVFDDFAGTVALKDFDIYLSIFRSIGVSSTIMLQSESQLERMYGKEGAEIIRANCAGYVYFAGALDDRSADITSRRLSLPREEILYAPLGTVFVMQSGKKPIVSQRYPVFESKEYEEYLAAVQKKNRKQTKVR